MVRLSVGVLILLLSSTSAFVAPQVRWNQAVSRTTSSKSSNSPFSSHLILSSSDSDTDNDAKKNKALEGDVRNRLLTESIAPWRSVRLFLYFSLGSGAALGGFLTATGLAAALSHGSEVDINTEVCTFASNI
jgi:hypothetical protein